LHIFVVAIGTAGDVYPLLGLSKTLVAHGHRISFCTSPVFRTITERCGLRFVPLGTEEDYYAAVNDPSMWNPRRSLKTLWKAVAARIEPMLDLLCSEIDGDTLLAAHPWAFAARLINEKYDVPLVTLQISPSTFFSAKEPPIHKQFTIPKFLPYPIRVGLLWAFDRGVLDQICGPDINRIRATLGLRPITHIAGRWIHSPQGVLGLFPDWFATPQTDWPRNVTLTGFPLFDGDSSQLADDELEAFLEDEPKPIVFTPGSTVIDDMSYYLTAASTLNALGQRGVFLASKSITTMNLPRNILARPYVPLSKLLPRAKALVHHGGIGTAAQALAAGIPQLITPFAHDQFDNAVRVQRLGCGLQASAPGNTTFTWKPLKTLLESDSIQQRCKEVRSWVEPGETACRKALSIIESLTRTFPNRTAALDLGKQRQVSMHSEL